MIPLLSRKSIVVLSFGVVLGIVAGLGYWAISPLQFQLGWPPITAPDLPALHESTVEIEPAVQGALGESYKTLQRQAEDIAWRLESTPFYGFLINRLSEDKPDFAESAETIHNALAWGMEDPEAIAGVKVIDIKVTYEDIMTRVAVRAYGQSPEEADWIAASVPVLLREYLVAEEIEVQLAQYQEALVRIDSLKEELSIAREELSSLSPLGNTTYLELEASLIMARALRDSLRDELYALADGLAGLTAAGATGADEYNRILNQIELVSADLARVQQQADTLELQLEGGAYGGATNLDYVVAYNKVSELSSELDNLSRSVAVVPTTTEVEKVVESRFLAFEPTPALEVPVEKIRGRNAVAIGAVLGVGFAWLGLNRRQLMARLKSSSLLEYRDEAITTEEEEKEDEE